MYNDLECKIPAGGTFGYIHVANILVVIINITININITKREFEFMIIFNIKNCVLIAKY